MPATVHKTICDLYRVRVDGEWASICLSDWQGADVNGRDFFGGEIQVRSSFGNFSNSWNAAGTPFRKFLQEIESDYFFSKCMGADAQLYDGEGTWREIARQVLECRQDKGLTKEEARGIWSQLMAERDRMEQSDREMVEAVSNFDGLTQAGRDLLSEPWGFICNKADPQSTEFWRVLWPEFIEQLRFETDSSSAETAPQRYCG